MSVAAAESALAPPVDLKGVKPFGTSIANQSELIGGGEITIYEYTVSPTAYSAALTHWQFTTNGTSQPWTVRMYIDYETVASIQFSFDMDGGCESCGWCDIAYILTIPVATLILLRDSISS